MTFITRSQQRSLLESLNASLSHSSSHTANRAQQQQLLLASRTRGSRCIAPAEQQQPRPAASRRVRARHPLPGSASQVWRAPGTALPCVTTARPASPRPRCRFRTRRSPHRPGRGYPLTATPGSAAPGPSPPRSPAVREGRGRRPGRSEAEGRAGRCRSRAPAAPTPPERRVPPPRAPCPAAPRPTPSPAAPRAPLPGRARAPAPPRALPPARVELRRVARGWVTAPGAARPCPSTAAPGAAARPRITAPGAASLPRITAPGAARPRPVRSRAGRPRVRTACPVSNDSGPLRVTPAAGDLYLGLSRHRSQGARGEGVPPPEGCHTAAGRSQAPGCASVVAEGERGRAAAGKAVAAARSRCRRKRPGRTRAGSRGSSRNGHRSAAERLGMRCYLSEGGQGFAPTRKATTKGLFLRRKM